MSIFEPYTEWIAKGKFRLSVVFRQKISVNTDLIVFHKVMNDEQDKDGVIEIADAVLQEYKRIIR